MEAVFVVDGSPDNSLLILNEELKKQNFEYQLISHSRNFGSFPAIQTGIKYARGDFFAIMAADLQEPKDLILNIFRSLGSNECDVAIGVRESRADPLLSKLAANMFWGMYKFLVMKDMPVRGVDVFGGNLNFRNQLILLKESNSSLIGLMMWIGFRRKFIPYTRQSRADKEKSAWTFKKKFRRYSTFYTTFRIILDIF
jgi:glycosyltransferase involved in cell wall biosynthesis